MSEWIDFQKNKPDTDIVALVCNKKGWMFYQKAVYHKYSDIWVLDSPSRELLVTLDVTHYLPIPDFNFEDYDD
jgi:hypothetical protein